MMAAAQAIRADQVGSLLRPRPLIDVADRIDALRPGHSRRMLALSDAQTAELRAAEDEAIVRAIELQVDCGLDIVTDGEYRRTLYTNSFFDSVDGLRAADPNSSAKWKNAAGNEVRYPGTPVIDRRLVKVEPSTAAAEAAFLARTTDRPFKITLPAASFFLSRVSRDGVPNGYDSRDEFELHIVEILRELMRDAIDAGARHVQLDFPAHVFAIDEGACARMRDSGVNVEEFLDTADRADSSLLDGLPRDVTYSLHLCRGNYRSNWLFEGALDPIAERLFSLPYDRFLVEWDDPSRDGGFEALRFLPAGKVAVLGLVDSKVPDLESEDDLLGRIEDASKVANIDQLALSPQCGFASEAHGNLLDEDSQWKKLALVGRVAHRVWG
jgi:5-methyltetrahydropteroyltriglutamate--homocysteine methyltransferase